MARRYSKLRIRGGFVLPSKSSYNRAGGYSTVNPTLSRINKFSPYIDLAKKAYNFHKANPKLLPAAINLAGKFSKDMFHKGITPKSALTSKLMISNVQKPTNSFYKFGTPLSKSAEENMQTYVDGTLQAITTAQVSSALGQQNTAYITHGSLNQLQRLFNMQLLTQSTSATNVSLIGYKLFFEQLHGQIEFQSASNTLVHLVIRQLAVKRDVQDTTGTDPLQLSPLNAWANVDSQDYVSTFPGGTNPASAVTIGGGPLQSNLFNVYYQILDTQTIDLLPGSAHTHKYTFNINKMLYAAMVNSNTNVTQAIFRDFTFMTMFTVYGSVVHDTTNDLEISYGPAAVDAIVRDFYRVKYIPFGSNIQLVNGGYGSVVSAEQFLDSNITDSTAIVD